MTNFRLFQTERVCRRQPKVDENGGKFFKGVENTVEKEEIACYNQFLLFPQCFQDLYSRYRKNRLVCGRAKGIMRRIDDLTVLAKP